MANKTNKRSAEDRALIRKTARITGISERSVERVTKGEQQNEVVMKVYIELQEHSDEQENNLKKLVRQLVPIPTSKNQAHK